MALDLRVQIILLMSLLQISTSFRQDVEHYIRTPSQIAKLKSNSKLRPIFSLFWGGSPFWIDKHVPSKTCPFTNCYYADDASLDPTLFEAIFFVGEVKQRGFTPKRRLPHQKYIFFTLESSSNFPVTLPIYNNFFNWTWTYKLSSTKKLPYFSIFDRKGNNVGPEKHIKWIENMDSINASFAAELSSKRIAAAWVVSKCETKGKRENYARDLKKSLKSLGLELDVYGKCGQPKRNCTSILHGKCSAKIKRDYYFYLSFENSIAEDYVTEKVYNALINNAVPIVYGGADYSRFLPRGSYLNARKYTPSQLASKMKRIIDNRTRYNDFFRWRNHYKYTLPGVVHTGCRFCSALNYDARMKRKMLTTFADFTSWWNK